jgi:hypothetical protein
VVLVHAEAQPAAALRAGLLDLGFNDVLYPAYGDSMDL